MRLAQIEGGVVMNVIEVDLAAVPDWCADWPEAGDHGPGDTWLHAGPVVAVEIDLPLDDALTAGD